MSPVRLSVLLAAMVAALGWSQRSRVFRVAEDPPVRYWWGSVPPSARDGRLATGSFSNIEPEDFVGPRTCRGCHRDKFDGWSEHRHRFMNAPAQPETIHGDFDSGATIDYFGGRASFSRRNGRYLMKLDKLDVSRTYHVTQSIGSRFFQYYVGRQIDGPEPPEHRLYQSEHVLPFGYWIDYAQWVPVVHVEKTREGEPSLVDSMRRDPYRDPAVFDYAQSCSQCHTTLPTGDWLVHRQPSFPMTPRGFDFDLKSYVADNHAELVTDGDLESMSMDEVRSVLTAITHKKAPVWELASGISCETCHYGGRAHVESGGDVRPRMFPVSPRLFIEGSDPELELARNPTNQNWTCGRCHQGTRFEFAAGMGTWNSTEHSDAMKGACYRSSDAGRPTLRCVDCHNPHQTTGKAWSRSPDEDDRLCLKCHEALEPATARRRHTHHPAGSPGARCMNCHMPRINEGLQDMVRTHMIFSPTNRAMLQANQPNACNMCHVRETLQWTVDKLRAWYGVDDLPYPASEAPATLTWLESWHPTTQMVAADVLTKAEAEWALPQLLGSLDSRYMLVRQFAFIGLDRMLERSVSESGYRFYMFAEERQGPLGALRQRFAPSSTGVPTTLGAEGSADVEHFRQLVAFMPDSPTARYYLGNALVSDGRLDLAVEHYEAAIALDERFARAYNNLGVALTRQGRWSDAERHHLRALEIEPALPQAHVALGNLYAQQQREAEAEARFELALSIDPELKEAHYNLGLLHHAAGRIGAAAASYRSAVASDPEYAEALNNLGIALSQLGRSSEALQSFERAVAWAGPDVAASAHNNLAWALELDGRRDDALEHFEAALEADPQSVSARVGLATILSSHASPERRNVDRAVRLAEEASRMTDGANLEALDVLSRAYAAAGDYARASEALESALELMPEPSVGDALRARLTRYRELR